LFLCVYVCINDDSVLVILSLSLHDALPISELMDYVMGVKAKGTAIIFVTHDMNIVDAADCVVVLKQGKVAFSGTPNSLWKKERLLHEARLRLPSRFHQKQWEGEIYDVTH